MPTLKLHYEGWLALPAALRQKLGLNTGDRLDVDLVDGAIVLRPASTARQPMQPEEAIQAPAAEVPPAATPARRKPGRPRKVRATDELVPAPAPKRPRGRPRKAAIAAEPKPAFAVSESWKLRKKADLQPAVPGPGRAAASDPHPAPVRKSDTGSQLEERRPFRNVEVRKLGPGRGYTRARRLLSRSGDWVE